MLLVTALAIGSGHAAVTIADFGGTAPVLDSGDVGNTISGGGEFGWNGSETFGQSFTLASAGTLDSIYFAYRGKGNNDTQVITVAVDGTAYSGIALDGSSMKSDGSKTDYNWARIDFTGENVSLDAGSHHFLLSITQSPDNDWVIAPQYSGANPYGGGRSLGNILNAPAEDLLFAVSTSAVPEPSSAALLGLGGIALVLRRRK